MKRLATSLACAVAVAAGIVGAAAPSASALVNTCSGPAASSCTTPGYHSYSESRSSKTGGAAAHVCTQLVSVLGLVLAIDCSYNGTFIRTCYYGASTSYGQHWGSSNDWTINGRDATPSDATTC
ncbi:MAG: hypothetical protein ITG02_03015 [Patulibacter sp.]|nr:hypothetical protein [Patulibacter sp.]